MWAALSERTKTGIIQTHQADLREQVLASLQPPVAPPRPYEAEIATDAEMEALFARRLGHRVEPPLSDAGMSVGHASKPASAEVGDDGEHNDDAREVDEDEGEED